MSKRIYRTSKGQTIDMERLRIKNEDTIAAGNMKVNARGDKLDAKGKVEKTSRERIKPHYSNKERISSKKVSIKAPIEGDDTEGVTKNADKVIQEMTEKPKTIDKSKERILEDGSIVIEDEENDDAKSASNSSTEKKNNQRGQSKKKDV